MLLNPLDGLRGAKGLGTFMGYCTIPGANWPFARMGLEMDASGTSAARTDAVETIKTAPRTLVAVL